MNTKEVQKNIIWFTIIAFALTWGWALFTEMSGNNSLPPIGMFGPMLSAFFVQRVIVKKPILGKDGLGFIVGKKQYWILGPAFIAVLLIVIFGITYLATPDLFLDKIGLIASLAEANLPLGDSLPKALLILFGMNVLLAPFINMPLMLGEEVGWRAFLTPNMMRIYGKKGLIWANVIWALWHVPMFFQGLNYSSNPWLGIPFMIGVSVSLGIIFQTIYQRSGSSVWAVALMHGVLNQGTMTVMSFLLNEEANYNTFIHGPSGIIGIAIMGLIGIYFYQRYPLPAQDEIAIEEQER